MILEQMRSYLWKLELGFWTYGWIRLLGPSGPNVVSRPRTTRSGRFFETSSFYCIYLMIVEKMRSCLWKLGLGFSTNSLISPLPKVLGPNCPELGFRSQTKRQSFGIWIFFHVKFHKILHQISSYFQILGFFWQSYERLFPEHCKKASKNFHFGAISDK